MPDRSESTTDPDSWDGCDLDFKQAAIDDRAAAELLVDKPDAMTEQEHDDAVR